MGFIVTTVRIRPVRDSWCDDELFVVGRILYGGYKHHFSGSFFCFFRFFFMWSFLSGMEEFKLAIFQRRCCCDCSARMYKYTMRLNKSAMVIVVAHGFSMVWLSDRRVKSSQNVPHSSVFSCFDGVSYKVVYYISHLIDIYACRNIKCTIIWIVWLLWWKEKGGRRGRERKYI